MKMVDFDTLKRDTQIHFFFINSKYLYTKHNQYNINAFLEEIQSQFTVFLPQNYYGDDCKFTVMFYSACLFWLLVESKESRKARRHNISEKPSESEDISESCLGFQTVIKNPTCYYIMFVR